MFPFQRLQGGRGVWSLCHWSDSLGEGEAPLGVALPHALVAATRRECFLPELPNRLQHPIARLPAGIARVSHQAVFHEGGQEIECWAQRPPYVPSGVERKPTGKDGQ